MPFESLIILLAPAAFLVAALLGRLQDRSRPVLLEGVLSAATLIGLVVAVIGGVLAYERGTLESALLGYKDLGLSVRVDPLSAVILAMIAILAFVIVRFSRHYLDGDPRKGVFLSRLAATVAAVELLVISGNLGLLFLSWIATSLALHQLLIFYPERKPALIAARKKFIAARVGDLCIGIAFAILYLEFSTGNLLENLQ